ncbi:MAG TPA: molybdopterin-guanine dinucleotide biosynthesis protein B [Spirochaetota bacterium]|nr:molybdopterin-guanine dinucleotide biosynthesis protein B [Spirochaetota bacterium]HPJ37579.1 molybdopterin-guanine dinucleotide biosynthesis protein B [Spirochaetota bacterium]HPQ52061.1 molybdopterin-guanine dinucleotide biosynthesis protein B [Spirochaetota bacterium]
MMNTAPPVITIIGRSNSGKTTLIERLTEHFTQKGMKIAIIKHMKHDFEMDHDGKDTSRYRKSGAVISSITNDRSMAILADVPPGMTPLSAAENLFAYADMIIIEGHKERPGPKIEVIGDTKEAYLFESGCEQVCAVVSDRKIDTSLPLFPRNAIPDIADFIEKNFTPEKK